MSIFLWGVIKCFVYWTEVSKNILVLVMMGKCGVLFIISHGGISKPCDEFDREVLAVFINFSLRWKQTFYILTGRALEFVWCWWWLMCAESFLLQRGENILVMWWISWWSVDIFICTLGYFSGWCKSDLSALCREIQFCWLQCKLFISFDC